MNAADQRRLSPWLAGACLLLAVVWAVLLAGAGRGIRWDAPTATRPLPAAGHDGAVVDAPPLKAYAEVWQRPLFTTDRRPVPVTAASDGQDASLDNLRLTGVILAPGMRMALLSDPDDGRTIRVAEGAHVGSGDWVLQSLEPRSAAFAGHGRVVRLDLKVMPQTAAGNDDGGPAAVVPREGPPPPSSSSPADAAGRPTRADREHIRTLRERIKQRRRDQAAQAGER